MNASLKTAIQEHAVFAAINRDGEAVCRYPYGSNERNVWVDAFAAFLVAQECINAAMSGKSVAGMV
jgi:hypothetical protein